MRTTLSLGLSLVAFAALAVPARAQLSEEDKMIALDGAAQDFFATSVSIHGSRALIGSRFDDDNGLESGSAYVFEFNGTDWVQTAKLLASDGEQGDFYGFSVALHGDTAMVGAWGHGEGGDNTGSVYVYDFNGTSWIETQELTASDATTFDELGFGISIDGDRAVLGARFEDSLASLAGAAYVFERVAGVWTETAKLTASDFAADMVFGSYTSVDGDTIVVGAPGSGTTLTGAAYVYELVGSSWVETAKLQPGDLGGGDRCGITVDVWNDTIFVGAPFHDGLPGANSGACYVFGRSGPSWIQTQKLVGSDTAAGDRFGEGSATLHGATGVVGASRHDSAGNNAGAAYVFENQSGTWVEVYKILGSDTSAVDLFGVSGSIYCSTVVIGATNDDDNGNQSGSAYVFIIPASANATQPVVTISSPAHGAVLGTTDVLLEGDVQADRCVAVTSTPAGVDEMFEDGVGSVSALVPLVEGPNVLSLSATDSGGLTGGTSVTVIRDTILPSVAVVTPTDGSVFGASPVSMTVNVVDATETLVQFGGNSIVVPDGGGLATGDVALVEGVNAVSITATDEAGNVGTAVVNLILDLTAPLVTIQDPPDLACFGPGDSPVAVTATIDDLTETTVSSTPGGVSGTVPAGGGVLAGSIALAEGSNTITISATDEASRNGSAQITVVLDTTGPSVVLNSPVASNPVSGEIDFMATAVDVAPGSGVSQVDFLVDSSVVASLTAPPFEILYDTEALADGLHDFAVTAIDGKGNSSTSSATVLVDNTLPAATITTPLDGDYVAGVISFDVAVADGGAGLASVEMLAAGLPPNGTDGSIDYAFPVGSDTRSSTHDTTVPVDGPLLLSVRVVDFAGNEDVVSVTVTVDNTIPNKAILDPADGAKVSAGVGITATGSDVNLLSLEIQVDNNLIASSPTSPLSTSFDSTSRLDGDMSVSAIARDLAGNFDSCNINVVVDNIGFRVRPSTLNLGSSAPILKARTEGPNVTLMMPRESHTVLMLVPGASPVAAKTDVDIDDTTVDLNGDGDPELRFEFRRLEVNQAIEAGIASGSINPNRPVPLTLVVDGFFIGLDHVDVIEN